MFFRFFRAFGLIFILLLLIEIPNSLKAQCPEVEAMLVDACGTEQWNEFVIIHSGSTGFNTNNILVDFPLGNNAMSALNNDINTDVDNFPPGTPCGLQLGNPSAYTGCTNIIAIGPGFNVPPDQIVILQLSAGSTSGLYDFSSLCGGGECIYVISNTCQRTIGGMTNNNGSGPRTTNFDFGGGCTQSVTYDTGLVPGGNGGYYLATSDSYGNNGCVVPPSSPAPDPEEPDFSIEDEYCVGDTPDNLPTISDNGVNGTWNPTSITTASPGTTNYVFTPASGQCAIPFTLTVTVSPNINPAFSFQIDYCQNETPDVLPLISNNGVTGSWSPPVINTSTPGTFFYDFTPDPDQCAIPVTINVTIFPLVTPVFTIDNEYCVGDTPDVLPGSSNNGITGTWSPAVINTSVPGNTLYTFTPDPGQCAFTFLLNVLVSPLLVPNFMLEDEYCVGEIPDVLVNTSPNGISGTWNPANINTSVAGMTSYTFTPDPGQCAGPFNFNVTVSDNITPSFSPIPDICEGATAPTLPTTSNNGITGTWNPSVINTSSPGTFMYTFTPNAGQCAEPVTIDVTILEIPRASISGNLDLCPGDCGEVSFNLSGGSGLYNVHLTIFVGALGIPFNVPGATVNSTLTICYTGTGFLPQFQPPSTLLIPMSAPPITATLTLTAIVDANGGPCINGQVGNNTMSVTLRPLPDVFNAELTVCDEDNDGSGIFDLTETEEDVTGNNPNATVTWYSNSTLTNLISNPTSYAATDGTVVYALVEDEYGCQNDAMVTLHVIMPEELDLPTFTICITDPPLLLPTPVDGITGNWSDANGHVSGNQFDPNGLAEGNYTITFNPDPGQCFIMTNTIVQVTSGGPIPLNGLPSELCVGFGIYTLPDMPNGVTGTWSSITPHLTGTMFNVTAAGTGTYTFTFTPDDPNSCFLPNSISIDVIDNEDLQAPVYPLLCENFGLFTLTVPVDGATGSWGGNPFVNSNQFNTLAGPGMHMITFFPDDDCKNNLDVLLTVEEAIDPTPPSYPNQCLSSPPIVLPLILDGIAGIWTLNGTVIATFNPANTGNGLFELVFTPNPGLCANGFSITITVGSVQAGADKDTSFCNQGSFLQDLNLFLSPDAQAGGTWFSNGMPVPIPTTFDMAGLMDGANLLLYVLEDPTCGNDTAFIRIQVQRIPDAGNDAVLNFCQRSATSINVAASMGSFSTGGTWSNNRNLPILFSNFAAVDLSSLPAGTTLFTYRFDAGICPGDTALITMQVDSAFLAGPDAITQSCVGSSVNLSSLISVSYSGGQFQDVNMYGGLSGNNWDASGKPEGDYIFLYITNSNGSCFGDTAYITVMLENNLSAGDDVLGEYCDGAGFMPIDFMPANASPGGKLFNGPFETPLNMVILGNLQQYQYNYITGDGITCPFDTAVWIINKVNRPNISFIGNALAFCEGDCADLIIRHNSNINRDIHMSNLGGFSKNITMIPGQDIVITLCNDDTNPYSFTNIPVGANRYIADTVYEQNCAFSLGNFNVSSFVRVDPTNTASINRTLCAGETLTKGNITFDESNPTGTVLVPGNGQECDTIFTVNLSFAPEARGSYIRETCNQNFSVNIGSQQFNRANPSGSVTLPGASSFGCDSIVDVNLTFLPPVQNDIDETSCDPAFRLTVGNTTFDKTKPSGQVTFFNGAINGCDSIVNVNIRFISSSMTYIDTTVCDDSFTLTVGGTIFTNQNPGGQVTLPGSASNGCDSIVNVNIIFQNFTPNQITTLPVCGDSLGTFAILNSNTPGPYTLIINGVISETITVLPYEKQFSPGDYDVGLEAANGCLTSFMFSIPDNSNPNIRLDSTGLNNAYSLSLNGDLNRIYNISWSPASAFDCANCSDVNTILSENITGQVSYQFGDDCIEIIPFALIFKAEGTFEIPNAIKIGSGANGSFYIKKPNNFSGSILSMSIYDRWGDKVFYQENINWDDPSSGWDGTFSNREVVPGVYVFRIEILDNAALKTILFQGDLTVIR